MNKKPNTSPKKPIQPKKEPGDDFGMSETLSPGVEDLLEYIESSQTKEDDNVIQKSQSESTLACTNETKQEPRKTKSLGPADLSQSPAIINVSMEEESSTEMDLVLLWEENQRLKKQISGRAAQAAEISYLRNQIKVLQQKEVEEKKKTTELSSTIPTLIAEKTEALKAEVHQLTTKLNFKDDEIRAQTRRTQL